ncbi:putative esterase [Microbacterium esteraromaticum]|uniref:Putative esterase n=1 Tax=Microbacterium esteraromaticum TaxID=57043 RepID=A0A1R4IW99_9MICO|nr:alpha/beta hydrolase [Microbacterium esteraromaticum]SJN24157.1 putative esterase [Microbacterium esteraromaticum]
MDIILIPGLWLDASAWDDVIPSLQAAGHRVHPLTMPGVGEPESAIGMAEWVSHLADLVDSLEGPVALVGHSGGGNAAWGAADARPDRIAHVVFVDTVPPAPGRGISDFETVDGVVPFPGWDFFPEDDVFDIDAETRGRTAPKMQSVPARVTSDPIALTEDRRFTVPVTLLMGAYDQETLESELADWGPYRDEYQSIEDARVVRIDSGHWPQFTVPDRLGELILAAVAR